LAFAITLGAIRGHPTDTNPAADSLCVFVSFLVAIVVGFVFGGADQYLGSIVSLGPWAVSVSGMSAPWLVLPFVFGCTQERASRAALVGAVATGSALTGYFVMTLSPIEGVSLSGINFIDFARSQEANIVGGVVTGPLFGWLGWRWRSERSWLSAVLVAGALCLEPIARLAVGRLGSPSLVWIAEVAIGISLAAYFAVSGMPRGHDAKRIT
jgi:hypothetical protein